MLIPDSPLPLQAGGYCSGLTVNDLMTHKAGLVAFGAQFNNYTLSMTEAGVTADALWTALQREIEVQEQVALDRDSLAALKLPYELVHYTARHRFNNSAPAVPVFSESLYNPKEPNYYGHYYNSTLRGQIGPCYGRCSALLAGTLELTTCQSYSDLVSKRFPGCRPRFDVNLKQTS